MTMQNKNIYLKNKILENNKLSDNAISVYIALRSVYTEGRTEYYINSDLLYYELYHSGIVNRYAKLNIKEGLQELLESKVITTITDISKDGSILDLSNLCIKKKEFYTIIKQDEVHKIMNLKNKDNFKILRYFTILMKTIDCTIKDSKNNSYIGYMSVDHIINLTGISTKTLASYNNLLEENEIIYVYHHDMIYSTGNDTISSLPNHYGRYANKNKIKSYAESYENDKKKEITDIKRKKKKAKENKTKQQEESRTGININNNKENAKVDNNDYDDVEF